MRPFRIADFGLRMWPTVILIVAFALGLLAAPLLSHGQQPANVYLLGWLVFDR